MPGSQRALTHDPFVSGAIIANPESGCPFPYPSPYPPSSVLFLSRFPLKPPGHKYWRGPKWGSSQTLPPKLSLGPGSTVGARWPACPLDISTSSLCYTLPPPLRSAQFFLPCSSHHSCPKGCRDCYCPYPPSQKKTMADLFPYGRDL